jgi:hypothetical protein
VKLCRESDLGSLHEFPVKRVPRPGVRGTRKAGEIVLWTVAAILLILWLAGVFTHVLGALIHVLLVIALVVIIIRLARGKKAA